MPEWHCEPPSSSAGTYNEIKGKYENEVMVILDQITSSDIGQTQLLCGFLAETPPPPPTEDRPISFYLSVVSLVYCVVLTIVFAVWASRHPRNTAVIRRVATRPPPQVVIQNQQV